MTSDRAEHPQEDLLNRATTALRDASIPGGPSADLVASTVRTLQALDHQPDLVRPRQRKNLMFRIARYSSLAAAVVLIAIAVGWLFVMDRTAATSLAAVIEQVSQTRSVSFKQTTTEGATSTTEKVVVLAEGLVRTESPGGDYTILDVRQGKSMFVSPNQKRAKIFLGFNARMPANFYETFRKLHKTATKRLPEKMIDGRPAVGFVTVMEADSGQAEMTVWVDPKTDLPVRLEADSQGQGAAKHTLTLHDIVFDAQLAPDLLRMEPPEGYAVTTEGIEKLPAPPQAQNLLAPEVIPGVGMGPARFGMTKDEIIRVLGEPDVVVGKGNSLEYLSRGYTLYMKPSRGWFSVVCYGQESSAAKVRDFAGKTKDGIGLGSSLRDLETALGKPDEIESPPEAPSTTKYVRYHKLGLEFTLFSDHVVQFMMSATKASAAKPAPKPGVKVEFRRAENQPGEGLIEAAVAGTAQKVYLHVSADVTNADIAEARAGLDSREKPAVEITFTEEGAKKMAKLTAEHRNRPLAILVDGKVIGAPPLAIQVDSKVLGAPVVRDTISQKAQITGNFTLEEVDRIVRGINGK
jgi:outer membrane lipoprotein-sorting protein